MPIRAQTVQPEQGRRQVPTPEARCCHLLAAERGHSQFGQCRHESHGGEEYKRIALPDRHAHDREQRQQQREPHQNQARLPVEPSHDRAPDLHFDCPCNNRRQNACQGRGEVIFRSTGSRSLSRISRSWLVTLPGGPGLSSAINVGPRRGAPTRLRSAIAGPRLSTLSLRRWRSL